MSGEKQKVRGPGIPSWSLVTFFILTFAISWGVIGIYLFQPDWATAVFGEINGSHPLFFLATWAPAISAFILVYQFTGWAGVKAFMARALLWRCPPVWVVFILICIPMVFIVGSLLKKGPILAPVPEEGIGVHLNVLLIMLFLGPIEEFGWRGMAQPILQRHVSPFWAGMLIGFFWGIWHLPAFFLSGAVHAGWNFFPFLLGSITLAILITPVFNLSGGSILWPLLFHWQLINPFWPDAQPFDTWILLPVAMTITWLKRDLMFGREALVTIVVPGEREKI